MHGVFTDLGLFKKANVVSLTKLITLLWSFQPETIRAVYKTRLLPKCRITERIMFVV